MGQRQWQSAADGPERREQSAEINERIARANYKPIRHCAPRSISNVTMRCYMNDVNSKGRKVHAGQKELFRREKLEG